MAIAAPTSSAALPTMPVSTPGGVEDLTVVLTNLAAAVAALQAALDAYTGAAAITGGGDAPAAGCGCGGSMGAAAGASGGPDVAAQQGAYAAPSAPASTFTPGMAQAPASSPIPAAADVPSAPAQAAPAAPAARTSRAGFDASGPRPTKLLRPVAGGRVTSRFDSQEAGLRTSPHGALDIAVPTGTSVRAAADGKVIDVSYQAGGGGNMVRILHAGGLTTLVAHLSRQTVKVGDVVQAGDEIGKSGSTGNSTGPHVHFEVREGGVKGHEVDPEKYL